MLRYSHTQGKAWYVVDAVAGKRIHKCATEMEAGLKAYDYMRSKVGTYTSGDLLGITIIQEGCDAKG